MYTYELLVTLALVAFCTWYFYYYYNWVRHMKKFAGPPTSFVFGNALDLRENTDVLHTFLDYSRKYGGLCTVRIGIEYLLIVTDYNFLEFLLPNIQIIDKSEVYKFLSRWLGTGLLTGAGKKWKKHRRMIGPSFHVKILEKFIETFNAQSKKLVEKLGEEVGKDSTNVFPYITAASLDITCETVMGISVNAQDNYNSDYVKSVGYMCSLILKRSTNPALMYEPLYKLSKLYSEEKQALKILKEVTDSVITKKKIELQKRCKENYVATNTKKKAAFLDLLLEATLDGEQLSHEDLREEVNTFLFAGHDTTAAALSFCVYSLAQYPDIQKKVYEEQKDIFFDNIHRPVTQTDLIQMKYLENVIKETLRLYPSVPYYVRQTKEEIKYDGKIIPKDISILIFAYGVHRKEEYFPEPEKFDPSRFETMSNKFPYAYIPFSAGPRNCIGQKFATMEMKVVLSNIVRNFEILPAIPEHKLKIFGETVLRAPTGVKVKLKERKA